MVVAPDGIIKAGVGDETRNAVTADIDLIWQRTLFSKTIRRRFSGHRGNTTVFGGKL